MIAICDHLGLLGCGELKQKVGWEALPVALDLLIEPLGLHPVEVGQVHINHHPQATNFQTSDQRLTRAAQRREAGGWRSAVFLRVNATHLVAVTALSTG